jgi:hypothetical protein
MICLDEINDKIIENDFDISIPNIKLSCNHYFHNQCLTLEFIEQLKNQRFLICPYCKNQQSYFFVEKIKQYLNINIKDNLFVFYHCQIYVPYKKNFCISLKENCLVQCKKKIKATNYEIDQEIIRNNFHNLENYFCSFHRNNFSKVKFFIHPILNYILKFNSN